MHSHRFQIIPVGRGKTLAKKNVSMGILGGTGARGRGSPPLCSISRKHRQSLRTIRRCHLFGRGDHEMSTSPSFRCVSAEISALLGGGGWAVISFPVQQQAPSLQLGHVCCGIHHRLVTGLRVAGGGTDQQRGRREGDGHDHRRGALGCTASSSSNAGSIPPCEERTVCSSPLQKKIVKREILT